MVIQMIVSLALSSLLIQQQPNLAVEKVAQIYTPQQSSIVQLAKAQPERTLPDICKKNPYVRGCPM